MRLGECRMRHGPLNAAEREKNTMDFVTIGGGMTQ